MRRVMTLCFLMFTMLAATLPAQTAREEDVTFRNGSITLAGTLSLPSGRGPFPAVVLLSGSGPQNRDSELFGFRPFKMIADDFTHHGIAVLRVDDRGVGGSSGSIAASTTDEFADDALAAVGVLEQRSDILRSRIGLLGHSEGAATAAIAASRSSKIAFVVWMAGSAVSGAEILQMQAASIARAGGASEAAVSEILRHHAAFMTALKENAPTDRLIALGRSLAAAQIAVLPAEQRASFGDLATFTDQQVTQSLPVLQSPWMRYFINFDPSTALQHVVCPVFAAFGGRDLQVPEAVNRTRLEAALAQAGNPAVTVRVYPEANHLFIPAVTGEPAEYETLPKAFVPSLLSDIATWIRQR